MIAFIRGVQLLVVMSKPTDKERNRTDISAIKVLLVDDHPLIRQAVRTILEKEHDISVAGEAGSGEQALELTEKLAPDVVIMDYKHARHERVRSNTPN